MFEVGYSKGLTMRTIYARVDQIPSCKQRVIQHP